MALTNPILDEISNLSPGAQAALLQAHGATAGAAAAPAGPPPPAPMTAPGAMQAPQIAPLVAQQKDAAATPAPTLMSSHMAAPVPDMGTPDAPSLIAPRGTVTGDKNEVGRLVGSGSGISQIASKVEGSNFGQNHPLLGKILGGTAQGLATLGDAAVSSVAPQLTAMIPGTEYRHDRLVRQAQTQLSQDEGNAEKEAQTQNLNLQPQLHQAQSALAQEKQNEVEDFHHATEQNNQDKVKATLAQHGFAQDEANPGQLRPLRYEEMSPTQQAVTDLKSAQQEQAEATAALKKAQNDPSSPTYRQAQERINVAKQNASVAMQRLGLSEQQFEMRSRGTSNGVALPGAMIDDEGQPVGTAFQGNIRPTGTERNKGDMATSADEQLTDIKSIMQKHRNFFGPGYGQTEAFKNWIGSEDPDAKRFLNARTIAADHLAGTFGGRSEAALTALDNAIGQFKDNPDAAIAGIDQLTKANSRFERAGTVRSAGSNAAPTGGAPAGTQTFTDGGVTYHIPTGQVGDFKKDHPNAR